MQKNNKIYTMIYFLFFAIVCFGYNHVPPMYGVLSFGLIYLLSSLIAYNCNVKIVILSAIVSYACTLLSQYPEFVKQPIIMYSSLISFLIPAFPGFVTGEMFKRKVDFRTNYTFSSMAMIAILMIHMFKISYFDHINIGKFYIEWPLAGFYTNFERIYLSTEGVDLSVLPTIKEYFMLIKDMAVYYSPAILISSVMCVTFIMFFISKKVIRLIHDEKFSFLPSFSHLIMPRSTSTAVAVMLIVSFFMSSASMTGLVVANILMIMFLLYFGCGLSLVDFYVRRKIPYVLIRIVVYVIGFFVISSLSSVIMFINPVMILIFVSMLDSSRDFRKISTPHIKIRF